MPEATFFAFVFHFFRFHPFTTHVTRALPLEAIKGEAETMTRGGEKREERDETIQQQQLEPISVETTTTTTQETWDLLPLSKSCNLYYEHPGASQHEPQ
jgi:hypothetical protein